MTVSMPAPALRCTVLKNPTGGHSPMFHLSNAPAPQPSLSSKTFPTAEEAVAYAVRHHPNLPVWIDED